MSMARHICTLHMCYYDVDVRICTRYVCSHSKKLRALRNLMFSVLTLKYCLQLAC